MRIPSLVLAGTHSGVGKTTLSMGIMYVLSRLMSVQPFKVGPDYIDPAFHTFITGRPCRNLDGWLLDEETLKYLFVKSGRRAEICLVEGVMGLYDGAGTTKDQGSTAHIAKILGAPVVLVIDGSGMAASAAALVKGYREYDRSINLRAVIINNIRGENHYQLLKKAIERDTGVKAFGYLPPNAGIKLPDRHLGLVPRGEIKDLQEKLELLGELIKATVDVEGLVRLAKAEAADCRASNILDVRKIGSLNLAVALDEAFNFYYRDNLDLLEEMGANLIYFSPLQEEKLPPYSHGLLLGGGFPEVFAPELEANSLLREEIGRKIKGGLPVYGECGGLMYLSGGIEIDGDRTFKMVGAISGTTKMTGRLQRFGYVQVGWVADNLLGKRGERARAHEFHHSILDEREPGNEHSFRVSKIRDGEAAASWSCGIKKGDLLASYPHFHFYSNPLLASSLLGKCLAYKKKEEVLEP